MRRLAAIFCALVAVVTFAVVATGASEGAGPPPYLVRAIFDNAGFAVPGETARIAGAPVGTIDSLDVCVDHGDSKCPPGTANKAALTLKITDHRFTPFYANAFCAVRPQSLIGERYVDCLPGSSSAPALMKITSGPGTGSYLLPVTRTNSPVDSDIVQDIYQQPIRERFALIINELGTGLAARGSDLNAVIHRANPSLGYTDQVLKILARENRVLAQLATDSDAVLTPLAQVRGSLANFVVQANTTAVASAARAPDIARSFQLLPGFLRAVQPLLLDLGQLTDQGTPLLASLSQSANALARQFQNLTPFAKVARPALIALGKSSQQSEPLLLDTVPLAMRLHKLGTQSLPTANLLSALLTSFDQTGGIEQLMALLFNGTGAANGFDRTGHYIRTETLVGDCTGYAKQPLPGCSSNFLPGAASDVGSASPRPRRSPQSADRVVREAVRQVATQVQSSAPLTGLLSYLIGSSK
jgi:ABC-type transporter Mla subunit MlaD